MKKYFIAQLMFLTAAISTQAESSTLDQQQPIFDFGATSYSSGYFIAQTFTAGFDQRLDKIEFYNYAFNSASADYPTTITIRETIGGKPAGSDIASLYFENGFGASGWFAINLSQNNIFLNNGNMYAIVFGSNLAVTSGGPTNGVGVMWNANAYLGGDMWTTFGGNGWQLHNGFSSSGADMTFKTHGTPTVPVPSAAWLFASGLLGFVGAVRKHR